MVFGYLPVVWISLHTIFNCVCKFFKFLLIFTYYVLLRCVFKEYYLIWYFIYDESGSSLKKFVEFRKGFLSEVGKEIVISFVKSLRVKHFFLLEKFLFSNSANFFCF